MNTTCKFDITKIITGLDFGLEILAVWTHLSIKLSVITWYAHRPIKCSYGHQVWREKQEWFEKFGYLNVKNSKKMWSPIWSVITSKHLTVVITQLLKPLTCILSHSYFLFLVMLELFYVNILINIPNFACHGIL